MSDCPTELRRLYRERRVIPFVGAGASMAVEWGGSRGPSWEELVEEAGKQIGVTDISLLRSRGSDLQILEYFRTLKGSFAPLTNWLSVRFSSAPDESILACPIHLELSQLDLCRLFYTTNYDNFLERGLAAAGRSIKVVSMELNINHDIDETEVVKFHGDFNSPDRMVLSESDYMDRMRLESPMDFKLRSDMLGRALLFMGYSFRDQNVGYIFHLVNRILSSLPDSFTGRRAYIILAEPSDFERRLFHARNIEVLSIPSHSPAHGVAEIIKAMRS